MGGLGIGGVREEVAGRVVVRGARCAGGRWEGGFVSIFDFTRRLLIYLCSVFSHCIF